MSLPKLDLSKTLGPTTLEALVEDGWGELEADHLYHLIIFNNNIYFLCQDGVFFFAYLFFD